MVTAAIDFDSSGKRWRITMDGEWIAIREYRSDGELAAYAVGRRRALEQGKVRAVVATLQGSVEAPVDRAVLKDGLESLDLHVGRRAGMPRQKASGNAWSLHHRKVENRVMYAQPTEGARAAGGGTKMDPRWVSTLAAARIAGIEKNALLKRFERGSIPKHARRRVGKILLWDSAALATMN